MSYLTDSHRESLELFLSYQNLKDENYQIYLWVPECENITLTIPAQTTDFIIQSSMLPPTLHAHLKNKDLTLCLTELDGSDTLIWTPETELSPEYRKTEIEKFCEFLAELHQFILSCS